jgi:hypothetical protein
MKPSVLLLALAIITPTAPAQEPDAESKQLLLRPAAAPAQALRYTLLPEIRDLQPGNAVTSYYRAFSPDAWGASLATTPSTRRPSNGFASP